MNAQTIVTLLKEIFALAPEIVAAVEALLADMKSNKPITPSVESATDSREKILEGK